MILDELDTLPSTVTNRESVMEEEEFTFPSTWIWLLSVTDELEETEPRTLRGPVKFTASEAEMAFDSGILTFWVGSGVESTSEGV